LLLLLDHGEAGGELELELEVGFGLLLKLMVAA